MDMRSVRSWLALAIAAGLATPALAGVEDGVRKWRAGDYAGAVAEWKEPAAKGNRDAQFNLGQAYKLGRGVAADPQKAIDFYRKAADQGHRSEEHTSELQSLMRISYAVFCLTTKNIKDYRPNSMS